MSFETIFTIYNTLLFFKIKKKRKTLEGIIVLCTFKIVNNSINIFGTYLKPPITLK